MKVQAGEWAWATPAARTLLDPRVGHTGFVVPGSYLPANLPSGSVPGAALSAKCATGR